MKRLGRPAWFALVTGLLDLGWAFSALQTERLTHNDSNVQMVNLVVWIFLHLPAAFLASLPYGALPDSAPVPDSQLLLMGFLGVAWAAGLAWLILWWLDRRKGTKG